MKKIIFSIIVIAFLLAGKAQKKTSYQNGDLIFQTSSSAQSKAVQIATKSPYSHMGIIFYQDSTLYVYEAIGPVKSTPLGEWIKQGEKGQYVVKRLKNHKKILTPENIQKLMMVGRKFQGIPYDTYFGWDDKLMYCSELVWKIYHNALGIKIGKLTKLGELELSHPLVKEELKKHYGDNIPLDEIVITPAAMFDSDQLMLVESN